jgi:hypothetical protein
MIKDLVLQAKAARLRFSGMMLSLGHRP